MTRVSARGSVMASLFARSRLGEELFQERLDLRIPPFVVADGNVTNDAALVDDEERRKRRDVVLARCICPKVDLDRIAHVGALREERGLLGGVGGDADDAEAL